MSMTNQTLTTLYKLKRNSTSDAGITGRILHLAPIDLQSLRCTHAACNAPSGQMFCKACPRPSTQTRQRSRSLY
eukprot:97150-Amphidinium_carterae.1